MSAQNTQQVLQQDPTKSIYINGEWQAGVDTIANINPSDTSEIVGEFAQASQDQVKDAIAAARQAQPKWEATPLEKRQSILQAIGDEMIAAVMSWVHCSHVKKASHLPKVAVRFIVLGSSSIIMPPKYCVKSVIALTLSVLG